MCGVGEHRAGACRAGACSEGACGAGVGHSGEVLLQVGLARQWSWGIAWPGDVVAESGPTSWHSGGIGCGKVVAMPGLCLAVVAVTGAGITC